MKVTLALVFTLLCWAEFIGSAHAQAAASASTGGASASASAAPALQAPPVIVMQDAPRVIFRAAGGACGANLNAVGYGGGGVNAFFVGGRGRIRQPRTDIRQRIRTRG
jgi:hypothetical protein